MVKSTSPRMLQREWSTYYSTCSLMSGSEARCCWVHIIPLAYSRNPRDAQAKICRKRPDKMKLSETLVAYLVEQLGARAPPTCHDQLGCTIRRRSPWPPHQPGTPSISIPPDSCAAAPPQVSTRSGRRWRSFRFVQQRVSAPPARSTRREHAVPATRTGHIKPIVAGRSLLIRP